MVSDQARCVRIGARIPPDARRWRPTSSAEQDGGEGQHDVAGRRGGDGVGQRRPGDRVLGDRGVHRAPEEQLLGDPVDRGHREQQRQRALVGVGEHRGDLVGEPRDLGHDEAAEDEDPGQAEAQRERGGDRALGGPGEVGADRDPAEVQRPGGERAHEPDPGDAQRDQVEQVAPGLEPQQEAQRHGAEHDEAGRDQLPTAQRTLALPVVARDDVPQRALEPAPHSHHPSPQRIRTGEG